MDVGRSAVPVELLVLEEQVAKLIKSSLALTVSVMSSVSVELRVELPCSSAKPSVARSKAVSFDPRIERSILIFSRICHTQTTVNCDAENTNIWIVVVESLAYVEEKSYCLLLAAWFVASVNASTISRQVGKQTEMIVFNCEN